MIRLRLLGQILFRHNDYRRRGSRFSDRATSCFERSICCGVDKEKSFGYGTSSRNSEVIHAGIYYPIGSWKSKLCLRGKKQLYEYCDKNNIPHKKLGKYIVSCDGVQTETLNQIYNNSHEAGMVELFHVPEERLCEIGTSRKLDHALYSPSTGIVDSHKFMESLIWELEELGGLVSYNSEVTHVSSSNNASFEVCIQDEFLICCNNLINAAGLGAINLRNMMPIKDQKKYENYYVKGNYFGYSSKLHSEASSIRCPKKMVWVCI